MADVAMLALCEPEQIDFDNYQDGGESKSFAPPVEGRYTAKAPIFKDDGTNVISPTNDFGTTQANRMKVRIDPIEMVGVDYKLKFHSLSIKKYANREGNQILDFLRACGIPVRPKTNQEYREAVKMASGRPFQFGLVWEAWNRDTGETLKGMANFPDDEQNPTKKQPWIADPSGAEDDKGRPKRIWANGKVKYYISALAKV